MNTESSRKVTNDHLKRDAFLYVRQSTLRQVFENTESTKRQYALRDTLILDEDGLYDPSDFNDRLLLGLKGTMSEAELHMILARCRGGILNKARRGEFRSRLPIGLVYGENGSVKLDPDKQVQETVRFFFETFRRTGSVLGVVRTFRTQELLFPRRFETGPQKGEVHWGKL